MVKTQLARTALHLVAAISLVICNLSACSQSEQEIAPGVGKHAQALRLDPDFDDPGDANDTAEPARDYTLFEADPVRPIAVLEESGWVVVANTFDDQLELMKPLRDRMQRCGAVKVGMRPVAVAVVRESRREATLWVVNHVSDSVSVVSLDMRTCQGEVIDTIHIGDEPRDLLVAKNRSGRARVFVTAAHRGQHHPIESARSGADLVLPAEDKAQPGLADVFVFDPSDTARPLAVVNLFSDVPRALALGDGVVYAAGFRTGNRTTLVPAERASARGVASLSRLLDRDANGGFIERDGELTLSRNARGRARFEGGMPAVAGSGRCLPDPRPQVADRFVQQVCVATDRRQRALNAFVQTAGQVHPTCQCTSGDGTLQPTSGVIVKFFERARDCGEDFTRFPDGSRGCWLDAEPDGVRTPAARGDDTAPAMAWNDDVRFTLPDQDVFAISIDELRVKRSFSGVGTVLFGMAVQPATGRLFVTNTEAQNLTRFEGRGHGASSSVIGHLHESRITVIDPKRGHVLPVHLNTHVDYAQCCERQGRENEKSFAFPTAGVFSPDGRDFYFSALGSDKVGMIKAGALTSDFDNDSARRRRTLKEITLGTSIDDPTGPVGLAFDERRGRVYVKTHFTNELVVVDAELQRVIERVTLHNPEPPSIRDGRAVFYDARRTSAHGDSACASCHVFGDFDGLAWDLGDPDAATVKNPGPFAVATEFVRLTGLAQDPLGQNPQNVPLTPDFRSNKGPMSTQTLRGMANHGAQHWRGDRTRRFQNEPGRQPNFGSLDEDNSFGEFDVAIVGLNGNDQPLDPALFQQFTDFSLQLTLPPNPVRALDDSLDAPQTRARALYFGCSSMTDEQFEQRQCVALDGAVVDLEQETVSCTCASNPLVGILRRLPQIQGFARLVQALFANPQLRAAFDALAANPAGLPSAAEAQLTALVQSFSAARDGLLGANLALDEKGLFSAEAAGALAGTSGALLGIIQLSAANATASGPALLSLLAGSIPANVVPATSPLRTPQGLQAGFGSAFSLSNLNLRALRDEAARGTADFHDLLQGCNPTEPPRCELRVSDSFKTCHGCHTLDPKGNAEFGVFRPGFFGTNGEYSFENESQVFKVPHLRNMYQKVGMFGVPQVPFLTAESVLGPRLGGFDALDTRQFAGPQLKGFGFLHDGSIDTLHRFHGAAVFLARPVGSLSPNDPGNARGIEAVLPASNQMPACVQGFRAAPLTALEDLDPTLELELCLASSAVPDVCFIDPASSSCREALAELAALLGDPAFPQRFGAQIRPACFQLGSMLEGGSSQGQCFPSGLREREELESLLLAFDTNMKPMVGQQLTLRDGDYDASFLHQLFRAAERGDCDLAVRQGNHGLLVTVPDGSAPERSRVLDAHGRTFELDELELDAGPMTFTCYPPQPDQAEARRSAFSRRQH